MNNLAYSSQDPNVVGPKVGELVTAETKSSPVYEIQTGDMAPSSVSRVVGDSLKLLFGGKAPSTLFTMHFAIATPRPMTLSVPLDRQGVGCHGGGMTYATELAKPIAADVTLGEPGFFSGAKFEGDPTAAGKLNANSALLKRIKHFVRTSGNAGGVDLTIPRMFRITPSAGGSTLVVNNLPKPLKMGLAMSLEIVDFAEIAELIQATL